VRPDEILTKLVADRSSVQNLDAPEEPGVYALFLREGTEFPIAHNPAEPLYVGTSGNLAQREFDTHFAAGQSGFSTVRRSFGALLLDRLDLKPRPRGRGSSKTNFRNYRFDDAGEQRLSQWMEKQIEVAVHPVADPKAVEKELIALACPPLNLTGWANPEAAEIKAKRKQCVELAEQAEPRAPLDDLR
jgi:hypothetical protein